MWIINIFPQCSNFRRIHLSRAYFLASVSVTDQTLSRDNCQATLTHKPPYLGFWLSLWWNPELETWKEQLRFQKITKKRSAAHSPFISVCDRPACDAAQRQRNKHKTTPYRSRQTMQEVMKHAHVYVLFKNLYDSHCCSRLCFSFCFPFHYFFLFFVHINTLAVLSS